jgi:hypothetical protein
MAASQNVAFQPPFDGVLTQHLHNATLGGKLAAISVFREIFAEPDLFPNFIDGLELVGLGLVWPNDAEVLHVPPRYFPEKLAEVGDAAGHSLTGFFDLNGEIAKIRHVQWLAEQTAIRDRIGAHPPIALWRQSF